MQNRSQFAIGCLAITIGLGVVSAASACKHSTDKTEATDILRVINNLRMADNDQKRAPLEHLKSLPCSTTETCQAQKNCIVAFEHHVRGTELGQRLKARLQQQPTDDQAAMLLEMNIEIEEGKRAMPACEQQVTTLRKRYKI
ncbi:MAG TPA: hypothetical protein PLJ27_09010 [Polyangiaceae bacterium]|nr:MAG: hypothetical protein BWY17_01355 [Deltaproteobacteria bacterium ADurb.Bin207]HNS95750.1 hypothetical protein [Polyangiaceae bacterium]HNZ22959.1 hypothetical protein [Polyangiaceae bacterium]HOD24049.1 hypothetical protein [Polyangiaceae bacterium]HOE51910.1 hypothetical protein [Polyangiaceae bacterium]